MNRREKFEQFLESLKGKGHDALIESITEGFNILCESKEEDEILDIMRMQGISWDEAKKQRENIKGEFDMVEEEPAPNPEETEEEKLHQPTKKEILEAVFFEYLNELRKAKVISDDEFKSQIVAVKTTGDVNPQFVNSIQQRAYEHKVNLEELFNNILKRHGII